MKVYEGSLLLCARSILDYFEKVHVSHGTNTPFFFRQTTERAEMQIDDDAFIPRLRSFIQASSFKKHNYS
jgi:hypothetical protein